MKKPFGRKPYPNQMACPVCRWEMRFLSIEIGYSCRNPVCKLHVKEVLNA